MAGWSAPSRCRRAEMLRLAPEAFKARRATMALAAASLANEAGAGPLSARSPELDLR